MAYVAKGWTAVEISEPETHVPYAEIVVPADILEHANHDRIGLWTRDADSLEASCRSARDLLAKGFRFVGLAAEARPTPDAKSAPAVIETSKKR